MKKSVLFSTLLMLVLSCKNVFGRNVVQIVIGFCQECAHNCLKRKRVIDECQSFLCHCSIKSIGVGL
ncbi:PREDICTED: defensin-like protein 222 [Camelina sativa]|uniref:Defensin-like protein 222 n=1 Tax=Camelina sativa TaxID=90675 RepID=A0ABM0UT56_CAMSA|nr:PREDICTED: defensin-like protein 222 [Camelina sativa]